MYVHPPQSDTGSARRGTLLPGVALAILVCGACLALVLNEYWLSSAQEELRTATTAAALAAAQQIATDDLLREPVESQQIAERIQEAGEAIARKNPVLGFRPAQLEFHLGRAVFDPNTGQTHTLETDNDPNTVIVIGHRDHSRGNPVALLAPALTGRSHANVTVTVEASITNLVSGVRPFGAAKVPAWPVAILESSADTRVQTWNMQIEQRQGPDDYRWDEETQTVSLGADGLPEILLQPKGQSGTNNAYLVDLGSGFQDALLQQQIENGWSSEDLTFLGGEFSLQEGPMDLSASDDFDGAPYDALKLQIGQSRIVLLYSLAKQENGGISIEATRLVAGRLMHVDKGDDGPLLTLQPAVVVTRTALLDEDALYAGETKGNPYIYKLSITQ